MAKSLKAIQCKDGWLVYITDSRIVKDEFDVYKLIQQNGLKVQSVVETEKPANKFIYAD
jgi:hypothetical protein